MRKTVLMPVNRAGWPFIGGFALIAGLLFLLHPLAGFAGLLLTAWCVYFFRDPQRLTPVRGGLIVSPADGRVVAVGPAVPPADLGLPPSPRPRVSIFLSIFDVHVNRLPVDGTVTAVHYRPGRFVNAALDKASEDNERNAVRIDTDDGDSVVVVQIAGLIARRIVSQVFEGQRVRAGERFGLIRFGSRVDLYLPPGIAPLVAPGQVSIGGETVVADLRAQESPRQAEQR